MARNEYAKQAEQQFAPFKTGRQSSQGQRQQGHNPGIYSHKKPGEGLCFAEVRGNFRLQPDGQYLGGNKNESSQGKRENRNPEAPSLWSFYGGHSQSLYLSYAHMRAK